MPIDSKLYYMFNQDDIPNTCNLFYSYEKMSTFSSELGSVSLYIVQTRQNRINKTFQVLMPTE